MAIDRRTVDNQLKALGDFHRWFAKKEIRHLPSVLNSGETIRAVTSGAYQGSTWLVTVTDQRILFLDKGRFYGVTQVELPLRQINSISYKTGLMYGELHIATSSGGKNTVKKLRKVEVAKLSSIVSSLISKTHSPSTQPSTQTQLMDVASQLERLATLVERGILTPQEFAAQKAKLLL
jgi:hypothetical protein